MPAVMRAAAAAEQAGVPTVVIGATAFGPLGRAVGQSLGVGHVPIVSYPGVISADDGPTFDQKVAEVVVPEVLAALTGPAASDAPPRVADGAAASEPAPRDIVVSGDLSHIQDRFIEEQWSDGLPVIPPTLARVEEFLSHTSRAPAEVLGVLPPENREATVWNVAVNGVMAGCRPEHLPVLLAVAECLADPGFRIQDAGSTFGWEPMVVLSGPRVEGAGFNSGTGVMRVGRQANTATGRFVRLYMRNVAGLRIPPGHTDQAVIGYTFNVALAEDEQAIRELGWTSYREDQGWGEDQTSVSVHQVTSISAPIYSGGDAAEDHLQIIAQIFGNAMGPWAYSGIVHGGWYPLLVLSPSVAQALARDGIGKSELRQYLHENVRAPAGDLERYHRMVRYTSLDLAELVRQGKADPVYGQSDDPERLVPMFVRPEWIGVVVAGNPGRAQSRAYIGNHKNAPVTRAVAFPGA